MNQKIYDWLSFLGYEGALNDRLKNFFIDSGGGTGSLQDVEKHFLVNQVGYSGAIQDMWASYLVTKQPPWEPTLYINFLEQDVLDPRITFTRSGPATRVNSAGLIEEVAADTPRFDYDPVTLAPRGLLIEEGRTNVIRNNLAFGAVAGTPGTTPTSWFASGASNGINRQILGTVVDKGITYLRIRYFGTATASTFPQIYGEAVGAVPATPGQTWAGSWYVRTVGTPVGLSALTVATGESGGTAGTTTTNITPSSESTRYVAVRTLDQVGTTGVWSRVVLTVLSGVTADITLDVGLPQLEQGAFATSVIPTTGAVATRGADFAVMTGTNFSSWFNPVEGTVFCDGSTMSENGRVFSIGDNSTQTNCIQALQIGVNRSHNVRVAAVAVSAYSAPYVAGAYAKSAIAYKLDDQQYALGGTAGGVDTTCTVPAVDRMAIGSTPIGTFQANGHIRQVAYFPIRRVSNQLKSLTSL